MTATPPAALDRQRPRALRVLLVTAAYNHILDGVALTLNRLVEYLLRHGVEVLVFAPVGPVAAIAHHGELVEAPSIAAPGRPEYRACLGLTAGLRRRWAEFAPDIVHIAVPDLLGFQAQRHALRLGIPVVASYHTRYETYLDHYRLGFLERPLVAYFDWFYRRCRQLHVPSTSMIDALRARNLTGDIRLWTRGVDAERFAPSRRGDDWRRRQGFAPDDIVVAFVGRLVREKRLDTLISMFEALARRGVAVRPLLVGDGPERAAVARALPGARLVGFLAGDELATAYASTDIFVFPSDTETFGNVTLEAMASGLPTVCADATGSRSLVIEATTGHLVDPDRPDLFADRVAALAHDAALRRRLGAAGRAHAVAMSWDAAMAPILAGYRELAP